MISVTFTWHECDRFLFSWNVLNALISVCANMHLSLIQHCENLNLNRDSLCIFINSIILHWNIFWKDIGNNIGWLHLKVTIWPCNSQFCHERLLLLSELWWGSQNLDAYGNAGCSNESYQKQDKKTLKQSWNVSDKCSFKFVNLYCTNVFSDHLAYWTKLNQAMHMSYKSCVCVWRLVLVWTQRFCLYPRPSSGPPCAEGRLQGCDCPQCGLWWLNQHGIQWS